MTKLRMFKGMTQNERISALEAVMDEKLHLFVLIPKTGNYVIPKDVIRASEGQQGLQRNSLTTDTKREKYVHQGGFLEFKDGKAAACNVLAGVGRIATPLLDEKGIEVEHVRYTGDNARGIYGGYNGFERKEFSLNNSLLAVDDLLPEEKMKQFSIPTLEFAAVLDVWAKYWSEDKGNTVATKIVAELQQKGFSEVRAEAIEMICRPEKHRKGGRKKA